jgi:DNA repair exonuclease SbcCD ATPase subunit
MNSDSDHFLHRLVVAALTIFVVASLLLAAYVTREIWLQQRMVGLSSNLQTNLEELEETTEEIQGKMSELETTTEAAPESQEWDDVNDLLEEVDQQLESIEETIDDVAVANEEVIDSSAAESTQVEAEGAMRTQADQVFTIFAALTGIAAIVIAVLLGMALRVHDNRLLV